MSNKTTNYNLIKPLQTENYNVDIVNNANMDLIDGIVKDIEVGLGEVVIQNVNAEIARNTEFEVIKTDYTTYKNVMTSESNVAELQEQINNNASTLAAMSPQVTNNDTSKKYSYKLQINSGKPQLILEEVI